jgi:hypothetical protein
MEKKEIRTKRKYWQDSVEGEKKWQEEERVKMKVGNKRRRENNKWRK